MFRSVTLKDLVKYYGCGMTTAKRRLGKLRTHFDKRRITVYDLAIYEGYAPDKLLSYLREK